MSKVEIVHIKERAFYSMIFSTVEVYRQESLGLLLGYTGIDRFIVEYAIPYQTAMKGYSWVSPKSTAAERMNKILKYTSINLIGDFHSHTQWGSNKAKAISSGDDIADMEYNKIYIIVAVNDKTVSHQWRVKNERIRGTLGEYEIEIGAYVLKTDYTVESVKIVCPSATGLGSL